MIQTREFSYPSADGAHAVFAREWTPEGAPRGVVQIVHGVAEHIGRYDAPARFLASRVAVERLTPVIRATSV